MSVRPTRLRPNRVSSLRISSVGLHETVACVGHSERPSRFAEIFTQNAAPLCDGGCEAEDTGAGPAEASLRQSIQLHFNYPEYPASIPSNPHPAMSLRMLPQKFFCWRIVCRSKLQTRRFLAPQEAYRRERRPTHGYDTLQVSDNEHTRHVDAYHQNTDPTERVAEIRVCRACRRAGGSRRSRITGALADTRSGRRSPDSSSPSETAKATLRHSSEIRNVIGG